MKNRKIKYLLSLGVSSLCILTTVLLVHNNRLTSSTSITKNNNDRTFVLDTPLNIEGTVGTLDVDNLSVYAPNCSMIENGVARLNNGKMIIYCPSGFNSKNYYYGFSGATLSEVSLTYNNNGSNRTIKIGWGGLSSSNTITGAGTGSFSGFATTGSTESDTITAGSSSTFINSKVSSTNSGFEDIYIHTEGNSSIDIISITITYACK